MEGSLRDSAQRTAPRRVSTPQTFVAWHSADHQEHLALLRTLDGLISRPDIQPHSSEFSEGFSILTRQLLEHFANEEAAMAAEGLSPAALEQHVSEHKQIIEQLTQLSFDLMARNPIPREHLVERNGTTGSSATFPRTTWSLADKAIRPERRGLYHVPSNQRSGQTWN